MGLITFIFVLFGVIMLIASLTTSNGSKRRYSSGSFNRDNTSNSHFQDNFIQTGAMMNTFGYIEDTDNQDNSERSGDDYSSEQEYDSGSGCDSGDSSFDCDSGDCGSSDCGSSYSCD